MSEFVRVRLDISYDGTDFAGWAVQPGQRTVQGDIEAALSRILQRRVRLTVAGRTDAGVHARAQVAHADLDADVWTSVRERLVRSVAGLLGPDVRVRAVSVAPSGFDARFAALWRRYEYRVTDAPFGAEPLRRRDTLTWPRRLDEARMRDAVEALLGEHDFAAFCRFRAGATTIRGLHALDVDRTDDLVLITARADAFCHSMVRSLVGALIAVGEGRRPPDWPGELLRLRSRSGAVTVAAARGLTLVEIAYPPDDQLAARAELTRAMRTATSDG